MSYKSSQYKLDFKFKYKNVKKYNAGVRIAIFFAILFIIEFSSYVGLLPSSGLY